MDAIRIICIIYIYIYIYNRIFITNIYHYGKFVIAKYNFLLFMHTNLKKTGGQFDPPVLFPKTFL